MLATVMQYKVQCVGATPSLNCNPGPRNVAIVRSILLFVYSERVVFYLITMKLKHDNQGTHTHFLKVCDFKKSSDKNDIQHS